MSAGVWTDPDFDPGLSAFYYAKVIEIPTPRWTAYEAQRFGIDRPDEVPMPTQQLERPLDFLVVADHAENLGLAPLIAESDPSVLANPRGKMVHDLVKSGKGTDAFDEWIARMQALEDPFAPDTGMAATAWTRATAAAEEFNEPGVFTPSSRAC